MRGSEHRLIACLIVLLAAVGGATVAFAASSREPTSASNQATAQSDSAYLLSELPVPPGAKQSSAEPAGDDGLLARPGLYEATPNLVDHGAWWTAPGSPGDVLSYIDAHLPPGGSRTMTSSNSGPNQPTMTIHGYSWAPVAGALSQRWLIVSAVALSDGNTGLRADGEDVWITTRPASEQVPAGVKEVSVTVQGLGTRPSLPRVIRALATVKAIVALADGLPARQPGASSCPADLGPIVRLGFLTASGAEVAQMAADPGGCGGVSFWIGAAAQPPLADASRLVDGLHRLGAIPPCTSTRGGTRSRRVARCRSGRLA